MVHSIAQLPWLAEPPADFAGRCRALGEVSEDVGLAIHQLAGFRLGLSQALSLSRAIKKRQSAGAELSPLSKARLAVLSNATFDVLADHLPAAAARHGVALEIVLAPFDQAMQEALDPRSQTARAGADAILLALDHRWYGLDRPALEDPDGALANAVSRLTMLLDALEANAPSTIILSTAPVPPEALFGNLDARERGSPRALVQALNSAIVEQCASRSALLLDTAAMAARVGADRWFDPVQHVAFKLPFASEFDAIYADTVGRLLGAVRGKSRKCLVLDLDNTLWGGVVGDDGLEGLTLGPGSAAGESFLAIQKMALDLKERGIILAVSSKNDDAVARAAFVGHPEMALRLSDLAVFQANWQDKASNLEAIAASLNIGLDALVLLDDNPAERAQVRAALPMVAVPELPDDPAWFPWFLASAGYFEAVSYSAEDRLRAESYASDAQRAEVVSQSRDLGDYLSALGMKLKLSPFDAPGRQRIGQLINKTNQFNLTTRRYTEAEVARMENDATLFTLQARLEDRFGDLGMISVVICRPDAVDAGVWEIDTWLMSCRVMGRRVEEAMFGELAAEAARRGVRRIIGVYRPTAKNGMVVDHYPSLGFRLVEETATESRFVADVAGWTAPDLPFIITRPGEARPGAETPP